MATVTIIETRAGYRLEGIELADARDIFGEDDVVEAWGHPTVTTRGLSRAKLSSKLRDAGHRTRSGN